MQGQRREEPGFRSRSWKYSYRSSSVKRDEPPDNILHDFYIPALSLAKTYDRVAGYFRSSSLAAASQGFTSFVGREGKMRLITGADLDPEDVKAILAGDQERFARALNERLERDDEWPEDVRRGVTLLAWMVANGYLEVRVALRRHARTGEPIPFESTEDGYFHEKWFVMTDEFGNRIYGTGSLNESKTALQHNFENLTMFYDWMGERDRYEVEKATTDFEILWNDDAPHVAVRKLPEAVRERLIRLADGITVPAEIDGTRPKVSLASVGPSALERLRFAVLRDAPKMPNGTLVGLSTAPVDPWPHQEVVVRRLVATWPYSYLLCDEVGLGKTIEAGLAFRCLYLSGVVRRILIAAPASLTEQWLRQMATKVLMPFGKAVTVGGVGHEYLLPAERNVPAGSLFEPDLMIISTGLLARRERAQDIRKADPFDIVLLDEAHAARRSNATEGTAAYPEYVELYKNLRDLLRPRARSLWLATATPMQLHPVEVSDLIALTNRVGPFQYAPRLTLEYYAILAKLANNAGITDAERSFLRRAVGAIKFQDPFLWDYIRNYVMPSSAFRRVFDRWLENGRISRSRRDQEILRRVLFTTAPLSRVMMRHTRELLEIYRENGQLKQNLARRHVMPLEKIVFSPAERRIYDQLDEYCKGLNEQMSANASARARNMMQFFLSFLRLRFASSLYAIQQTLKRRLERVEATLAYQQSAASRDEEDLFLDDLLEGDLDEDLPHADMLLKDRNTNDLKWEREKLQRLLQDLEQLQDRPSKLKTLLRILDKRKQDGRIKQTVIFTRFFDTLSDIVKQLRTVNQHMRIGTYSGRGASYYDPEIGRMRDVDREEVKSLFLRGEIDVLVCTDAAAEGLNLQTADTLINFDLGWNPMKIEQRIGRIDRIGQRHDDIYVINLCYTGSAEEKVYGRLLERLQAANLVVGTQQISLLPVTSDDFRQLAEGTLSEEELSERAMQQLREQRERTRSMEIPGTELYDIYLRMASDPRQPQAPIDRMSIWQALTESEYLRGLGCEFHTEEEAVFCIRGVNGIPDGTLFTVSPEVYEVGIPDSGRRVHFASYGDPLFDALLDHMTQFELPGCIRRLEGPARQDEPLSLVGYAVACRTASGAVDVRLITSWRDLDNLELALDVTLDEAEVAPLRRKLGDLAAEEFPLTRSVHLMIERGNVRSARLQRLLELAVIRDLLYEVGRQAGSTASLNRVFREVEELCETRSSVLTSIPAEPFRREESLLFDLQILTGPTRVTVPVPRMLVEVSLDAARAIADSYKVRGGSVPVRTLLNRLDGEIERLTKELKQAG